MRRMLVLLLVAGLLMASTGALAQPGRGRGGDDDRRGPPIPVGTFSVDEGSASASGRHVSFSYGEQGVDDFAADGRTLFDLRVAGDGDDDEDDAEDEDEPPRVRTRGSEMRVRMPNYTFRAHDLATAPAKIEADGGVQVLFEEGVVLARENGDRVRFSFGDVTGALRGDGLVISGRNVLAEEEVLLVLDRPRGPFDNGRDLGHAIAKGHIGAEATLNLGEGGVEEDVVSYGNVTMTTVRAEQGNLTVLVEGHGFEGRVVVLNVDGRVLGADSADQLDVLVDNMSVSAAANLTDILDPDDDGYHPEYYLVFDPQQQVFQLLVTFPHYSVHTLSVTTPFVLPPPSVVIGIVAGVALLVPSALVLFRRK